MFTQAALGSQQDSEVFVLRLDGSNHKGRENKILSKNKLSFLPRIEFSIAPNRHLRGFHVFRQRFSLNTVQVGLDQFSDPQVVLVKVK